LTKRPSFQFYPDDWTGNANLRRCSPAARGVWLDVMCLMHDQDEYGVLRWPLKEIAQAAGASMSHVRELVDKRVLKGADSGDCEPFIYVPRSGRKDGDPVTLIGAQAGPIWYSTRMVKDEYVRTIRAEAGANGASPKDAPKPPKGEANDGGKGPRGAPSPSPPSGNSSAPSGAGGQPPSPPCAPKPRTAAQEADAQLWRDLKTLFVERQAAKDVKDAGVLLGALSSKYGADTFKAAARGLLDVHPAPVEPHTYLVSLCEIAAGKRPGLNRQEQLEAQNLAAAAAFAGAST